MNKSYQIEKATAVQSKFNIEFRNGQVLIEHQLESNSFDDDDSSIFLSFNKRESRNLFEYYKNDNIDDLFDSIFQHFTTYYSLKRFQQFFEKRDIHSLLSESYLID